MKIDEFISLVRNKQFIEAHEVLEDDWKELKKAGEKDKAKFIQGLINGTTAIALFYKGRESAFIKVWATFQKYKPLIDTIELDSKDKYIEAIVLLEAEYQKINN
ncbi:MAG: DUF309 domain-containing protein [Helicobacteraceae bacterium]|nr:DUF309 domain-containing protein [Helicobacteraceae bacterium]